MAVKTPAKSAPISRESTDIDEAGDASTPEPSRVDKPVKPIRSEGQRLLMLVPGSLAQIGEAIGGVNKQTVAMWRDGARIPEEKARKKLYAAYNIAPTAWDRAAVTAGELAEGDDDEEEDDEKEEGEEEAERSVMEDCLELIASLRKALKRKNLLARERSALNADFSRALTMKARLLREQEMLEDRTIRTHPKWKRLKAAITGALIKHPAAARDVEAAILDLLGEEADDDDTQP